MDYRELAMELMKTMFVMNKARPHKEITEAMHGESFVMRYLAHQNDYVLPSEISKIMGISSARVAAALNSLEKKGLITRQIDPEDRRRILITLTTEGRASGIEQQQEVLEKFAGMLSHLGEHDAREYVRIAGRLAEYASKESHHE
ncbi:MarR family transcriptional regulator [Anoxybacterium hadale]|uniref:MarR family transcriptional regulator n=1 Tax=Anoxybacterium hadale TaxID=3408580 RepID=A0ACD1A6K2_9FIRM|nr:MarR family transcriptional regulator [Clostridiales bacterium]